jgi:hypothetical protein
VLEHLAGWASIVVALKEHFGMVSTASWDGEGVSLAAPLRIANQPDFVDPVNLWVAVVVLDVLYPCF